MIGETLAHYRILESLGAGGMGEVYLAEDHRLGRQVAVKVLPADLGSDPRAVARFEREARALARVQDPSIVTIHEVGEDGGRRFLVTERVRGERLDRLIARETLPIDRVLRIGIQIAGALCAAHEVGVVHRDLKPANVIVTSGGLKVLDFGLAALRIPDGTDLTTTDLAETLTETGAVVGTLPYMAPEQLHGAPPDPRSDLFSFGVLLFEMIAGHRPFRGATAAEVTSGILGSDPPSLVALRDDLPADLDRIVRHCLRKDPDRRYQTAKGLRGELMELADALAAGATRPVAEVAAASVMAPPRHRTRPWLLLAATFATVAVLAGVAAFLERRSAPLPIDDPQALALYEQAERYAARGDTPADLELAEEVFRRALAREPANPFLQASLADLLARIQQYEPRADRMGEIEDLVGRASAADPALEPVRMAQARVALFRADWAAAEQAARTVLKRDPEHWEAYGLLGQALFGQGKVDEAVTAARGALERPGSEPWGRLPLARILFDAGRLNESAAEYEKVLQLAPDSPNALNNLGMIYAFSGRDLAAIPLFRRLLELKPDDAAATNLGLALYNLGRYSEAVDAFGKAHELAPDNPTHLRNLADAYESLGDAVHAREWLERAVDEYGRALDAGGPQAQLYGGRAVALAKLGRLPAARQDLARARELSPSDLTTQFFASQVAALAGDETAMLRAMKEAIAGGFPREAFDQDTIFAAYRDDPKFREVLLGR